MTTQRQLYFFHKVRSRRGMYPPSLVQKVCLQVDANHSKARSGVELVKVKMILLAIIPMG